MYIIVIGPDLRPVGSQAGYPPKSALIGRIHRPTGSIGVGPQDDWPVAANAG